MEFAVTHKAFQKQLLAIRPGTMFAGPHVLLNGKRVERVKGAYSVRNDAGGEVKLKLQTNFVDSIPAVLINGEKVLVVRALKWYEYVWVGIPILLVFIGGALGGGIGAAATYVNGRLIRSKRGAFSRYALTGLVSVCAALTFAVAAAMFQLFVVAPK
jgi:hypothetical protein